MTKQELKNEYDKLQTLYGSIKYNSVYFGGCEDKPDVALVFMNPTAKNIATEKNWKGIRTQWLGTKTIWKFLAAAGLFSKELNEEIQKKRPEDWTPEFCVIVYKWLEEHKIYMTNLAKCTQEDARPLPDRVFKAYKELLTYELEIIKPKKIILFGNQVSSIMLDSKISVTQCRKQKFSLQIGEQIIPCYPVYYPVGNNIFNGPKAVEDIIWIMNNH